MKAIYFIFLLSLVCCKTTLETIQCFLTNEKIITQVSNVVNSLKTEDFGKIFQSVIEAYSIVKNEVEKCLEEDEPVLQISSKPNYNLIKLEKCKMRCGDYYYDYECIKKCEAKYGNGFEINPIDILNKEKFE